jgi:hypothetical protein
MRETLLEKALKQLAEYEEPEFYVDESRNLVEEEIKEEEKAHKFRILKERKMQVLLGSEISKLALEEQLIEIAEEAAKVAVKDEWDPVKETDLVIAQSEAHYNLANCYVEQLLDEEIEIGYQELITIDEDQEDRDFTNDDRNRFAEWKKDFAKHIHLGVKLA